MFKEDKNKELGITCTPQYIDIDSLGQAIIITDFEHNLKLGLPKKKIKYGLISQFIYKKYLTYYITEIKDTAAYISLEINRSSLKILFKKINRPY